MPIVRERFWAFHDRLFERRQGYDAAGLKEHALGVGIDDVAAFETCLKDEKALDQIIDKDIAAGDAIGVSSTLSIYLNGMPVHGVAPELLVNWSTVNCVGLDTPLPRLRNPVVWVPPGGEMVPAEPPSPAKAP